MLQEEEDYFLFVEKPHRGICTASCSGFGLDPSWNALLLGLVCFKRKLLKLLH